MTVSATTFCPNCETDREFRDEERDEEFDVRGERMIVRVRLQVCAVCGESFLVGGSGQDPLEEAYAEYRRRRGLLTPDEIRGIRKQYGLSQRAFAKLLGMSQATINRYERGGLQDDAHDAAIRPCAKGENMVELLARRGHLLKPTQRQRAEKALAAFSQTLDR